MLIGFTTEGATRVAEIVSDALVFEVAEVSYGTGGYNPLDPFDLVALNPLATGLIAEVLREAVPAENTVKDTIVLPRGDETTFTSVAGPSHGVWGIGEAGLWARVTDPGTTGLALDYTFLLIHSHFPRVHLTKLERLAITWPLRYFP